MQVLLAISTKKRKIVRPRTRWSDNIADLARRDLCGDGRTTVSEISVDREVFRDTLGLTLLRGKTGVKMKEMNEHNLSFPKIGTLMYYT